MAMDPNLSSPREDGIWVQVGFLTIEGTGDEGCVDAVARMCPNGATLADI